MNKAILETIIKSGIRRSIEAQYISIRHTGKLNKIILGKRTKTNISNKASISIGKRFKFGLNTSGASRPGYSKIAIAPQAELNVKNRASIGKTSVLHLEGNLMIGNSFVNSHCRILCEDKIEIGDGCAISWNVQMIDSNRHKLSRNGNKSRLTEPIKIGDNVWIGHDVIKKGVTIGEGAVIGSGSVVTEDIPNEKLAVGSPAKVINKNVKWGKDVK